ncbi:MAG: lecithin retinol acyltransferase family protein [Planctomycetia bacterium]|nr:lecithin retinol acyltransferase family protein [Planctomycetia bacterium]
MAKGNRLRVERRFAGSTVTYMHHGIDVGDGTVVHARPANFSRPLAGGSVVRTSLAEFAGGSPVLVTTEPQAAFPPEEIVDRALSHVGRDGYCPMVDNCEHFVTWCATGARASRQVEIVIGRIGSAAKRVAAAVSARVAAGAAERLVVRTAVGTSIRVGLKTLVPAAIVAEGAALAAEWTAHQAGRSAAESRMAGESAGLATSAATLALAGIPGGPAGMVGGALAGAAIWAGGSLAFHVWNHSAGRSSASGTR